jgi:hypothetical protein
VWPEICRGISSVGSRGDQNRIDPAVKLLVDQMNTTGEIRTIGSCQGHAFSGKPPYVYFQTSVHTAAAIERVLRIAAESDDPALNFMWVIEGHFNQDYELFFLLYSPEQNRRAASILNLLPSEYRNRKRVNADLSALARIVKKAVLANVREKPKPEVSQGSDDRE